MRRVLKYILYVAAIVCSVTVLILVLADAASPELLLINSTDTDLYLLIYCIIIFISSIIYIRYWLRGKTCGGILSVILPNSTVVMSLLLATLAVTNMFNRSMGFVTSGLSKAVILITAMIGSLLSISLVECVWLENRK